MVLNVSEMEAKVREATNDDPWWVHPFFPRVDSYHGKLYISSAIGALMPSVFDTQGSKLYLDA